MYIRSIIFVYIKFSFLYKISVSLKFYKLFYYTCVWIFQISRETFAPSIFLQKLGHIVIAYECPSIPHVPNFSLPFRAAQCLIILEYFIDINYCGVHAKFVGSIYKYNIRIYILDLKRSLATTYSTRQK